MTCRSEDKLFQYWAREVKIEHSWTCQICGIRGVYLEAHHKNGWNTFPDQRYDIDNGVALCRACHDRFHEQFGYGGNTEYQYRQYEEIAVLLKRVAESIQKSFKVK